jgi:hypothetical protein
MAVRPSALENRERDLDLADRESKDARRVSDRAPAPEAELLSLRARIAAARDIKPESKDLHCYDCFRRGRDAALRVIEGE